MKHLLFWLLLLTIAAWLGVLIQSHPGYILIVYNHYSIEMTFWVGVVALLVLFILLYFLLGTLSRIFSASVQFKKWTRQRQHSKAQQLMQRGLCELAEGWWQRAEKTLIKGAHLTAKPMTHYLAAAWAAEQRSAYIERDRYLKLAATHSTDSDVTIGLTQAQLQLNSQQYERALATLHQLQQSTPKHQFVFKLLTQAYLALKDYKNLETLIPTLIKRRIFSQEKLIEIQQTTYLALIRKDPAHWTKIPKKLQHDTQILIAYTDSLIKNQREAEAELLIKRRLDQHWDNRLIKQYCLTTSEKPSKQLAKAENWLKQQPNNPDLLLCLGQLCIRDKLWGKAKDYLKASAVLRPHFETYKNLGYVCEQCGEKEQALEYYRKGLQSETKSAQ